jgi:hypothetical protein
MRLVAALVLLGACGRVGFDPLVTWIQPFGHTAQTSTDQLDVTAVAGDLVLLQIECDSTTMPTDLTVTAAGWTFQRVIDIFGSKDQWLALVAANAPDGNPTTITATWTPACVFMEEMGDELANATLGAPVSGTGPGDASVDLVTVHDRDLIWAACISYYTITDVQPGYREGAAIAGNMTIYRQTSDPPGTHETVTCPNAYDITAVSLSAR